VEPGGSGAGICAFNLHVRRVWVKGTTIVQLIHRPAGVQAAFSRLPLNPAYTTPGGSVSFHHRFLADALPEFAIVIEYSIVLDDVNEPAFDTVITGIATVVFAVAVCVGCGMPPAFVYHSRALFVRTCRSVTERPIRAWIRKDWFPAG